MKQGEHPEGVRKMIDIKDPPWIGDDDYDKRKSYDEWLFDKEWEEQDDQHDWQEWLDHEEEK